MVSGVHCQTRTGLRLFFSLDDDIFGDTVNLAARLESIAEPGGVCSSDLINEMIGDRISEPLRDLGMP